MWTTARSTASSSGRRIRSSWKGAGRSAFRTAGCRASGTSSCCGTSRSASPCGKGARLRPSRRRRNRVERRRAKPLFPSRPVILTMARQSRLPRRTPSVRFAGVEIGRLRGHERIRPALLEQLMGQIRKARYLRRPVLVADGELVILDGHHRVEAVPALRARGISGYLMRSFSHIGHPPTRPDAVVFVVPKERVNRPRRAGGLFPAQAAAPTLTLLP